MLKYPIGLLTADELVMAGASGSTPNTDLYLHTGTSIWLMTPMYYHINYGRAYISTFTSAGKFGTGNTTNTYSLRPVINLKASVLYDSGSGTEADPYKVKLSTE